MNIRTEKKASKKTSKVAYGNLSALMEAVLRAVARDQILLEVCGRPTSFLTTASSYAKSEDITQAKIFDDQIRGTLPEDTFSKAGT